MKAIQITLLVVLAGTLGACATYTPPAERPKSPPSWRICSGAGGIASPFGDICWVPAKKSSRVGMGETYTNFTRDFAFCWLLVREEKMPNPARVEFVNHCMGSSGWLERPLVGMFQKVEEGNLCRAPHA